MTADRREAVLVAATRMGARALFRAPSDLPLPWRLKRRWTELVATANRMPRGVRREIRDLGGVRVERLTPTHGSSGGFLLYLHGGGYVQGSPRVQRVAAARLAAGAGVVSHAPDYRLAPEYPFPAAFDDCLAAYLALAGAKGAERTVVAGDSAGAGLALAVALAARDAGVTPAAAFLICPWVDMTVPHDRGPDTDPILSRRFLAAGRIAYLDGHDPSDPRCSPLHGELAGLPPLLVHTTTEDPLRPDAEALAERAAAAGVEVELETGALWHDFHLHAGILRDAGAALDRGARFLRAWL